MSCDGKRGSTKLSIKFPHMSHHHIRLHRSHLPVPSLSPILISRSTSLRLYLHFHLARTTLQWDTKIAPTSLTFCETTDKNNSHHVLPSRAPQGTAGWNVVLRKQRACEECRMMSPALMNAASRAPLIFTQTAGQSQATGSRLLTCIIFLARPESVATGERESGSLALVCVYFGNLSVLGQV